MNCQEFQNTLDDLLLAEPGAADQPAAGEHVRQCADCARCQAEARQVLAALAWSTPLPVSPRLKEQILAGIAAARTVPQGGAGGGRRFKMAKAIAALAAAAAILAALVLFPRGPGGGGRQTVSAFGLFAEACAAENNRFAGNQVVHLLNEIVVIPVADATLAKIRWLPLLSLQADGKPRYNQLTLPAEPGKGYTVVDQSWYDPPTGRFARVLHAAGQPIFANAYDGRQVYTLETPPAGSPRIVHHPAGKDFHAPQSPADFLGLGAGLRSTLLENKSQSLASDAGKTTLADGAQARLVKLSLPTADGKTADSYWLATIRDDDKTIEKMEWLAQGKPMLSERHGKSETGKGPDIGWDLAGLAKQLAGAANAAGPSVIAGMVVPNIASAEMVKRAEFTTYLFHQDPAWAGQRQITDILDIPSPPHRMFAVTYRARDGRHVVLLQSFSYNKMLGPVVKRGRMVYTSPGGIKVWSGPQDQWLAKILLSSAQGVIQFPLAKQITGYLLETPAGTYPALAVNGKLSAAELHALIDSLEPAK